MSRGPDSPCHYENSPHVLLAYDVTLRLASRVRFSRSNYSSLPTLSSLFPFISYTQTPRDLYPPPPAYGYDYRRPRFTASSLHANQ
jgi:hypothetical protein